MTEWALLVRGIVVVGLTEAYRVDEMCDARALTVLITITQAVLLWLLK